MPNQEKIYTFALTSLDRVKDRLGLDKNNADAILIRMINSVTDYIENDCNRRFLETNYTNELHSVHGDNQTILLLKNAPVSVLGNIQYRQGLVGSPTWVNFTANDFQLVGDGSSGMVKFYTYLDQGLPKGTNVVRVASYTAGYKIDFLNIGDLTRHTLPADISELADKLVTKWYQRRLTPGKSSENFNGASITWSKELDEEDKSILKSYRRMTPFF